MPAKGNQPREHMFVVRVWKEAAPLGAARTETPPWRGSIVYVPSGERFYFASFGDLQEFIAGRLGTDSLGPHGQGR